MSLFHWLNRKVNKLQLSTSKRLGDLESQAQVLAGLNPNAEELVTGTSIEPIVHLPKNAAGGRASVGIKGLTATNLIKNSNFADGKTNWTDVFFCKFDIIDGEGVMSEQTSASARIGPKSFTPVEGSVYYISVAVKSTSSKTCLGHSTEARVFHSGSGKYEKLSRLQQGGSFVGPTIKDTRTEGHDNVYFKDLLVIDLTATFGAGNEPDLATCDKLFANWFDGTQSTTGAVRVRSAGKNLFDKSKVIIGYGISDTTGEIIPSTSGVISNKIPVLPNTAYTRRVIGGVVHNIFYYDAKDDYISRPGAATTTENPLTYTTPADVAYVRLRLSAFDNDTVYFGRSPNPYEPYTENTLHLNAGQPLRSLPNGTKDEIRPDGKGGYELVHRVRERTLQESDFISFSTIWTNINSVRVAKPLDCIPFVSSVQHGVWIPTRTQYVNTSFNSLPADSPLIGNYVTSPDGYIYFALSKSVTTLAQALSELAGLTLFYQLAEPIITPIQSIGQLHSYPSGTLYFDPILADVDFYGTGVVLEGAQFSAIERVTKIDLANGLETDITDTCALNAESNGFTSTALLPSDICWYELRIAPETTTQGELSYSYYDSRYAVVDDTNGKVYGWKVKSTNGTPRIELEEI